jgi:hypothetical protein
LSLNKTLAFNQMKRIFLLFILISSIRISYAQKKFSSPKNMAELSVIIPYITDKLYDDYALKNVKITVHNTNDIRVIILDEKFINKYLSVNSDSACSILAKKIKTYSKEKSKNFIDNYDEMIIILAKDGSHIIKGSTIDTTFKYFIKNL